MEEKLRRAVALLLEAAALYLPPDVLNALRRARDREENPLARYMLDAILKNVDTAGVERRPMCQDTGTVIFYVTAGEDFPLLGRLPRILREATVEATRSIPLRPNAVDPISGRNSGDNTGRHIPWIEWDIVPGSGAEITVVLKGGGSEAPSIARVVSPAVGLEGAVRQVLQTVFEAGPKACPPFIIGVGLGGTADIAMKLAKKALLRPVGSRHEEERIARLEERLLSMVNRLGWGPHGMGGMTTALDVHVEYAHRHPASYPIAVATFCWAARRSTLRVGGDGSLEFVTHPFMGEKLG